MFLLILKRLPAHLDRSRIPRAACQPREPGTIVRSVSPLRCPECAMLCVQACDDATEIALFGVFGRRRAVG
eukprot:1098035-Prymnesium_polylepis.1